MRVRMKKGEGAGTALVRLVSKGRRRYGGYIVHVGIVFMFIGFTGAAYDVEQEKALRPGETMAIGDHTVRYDAQPRMEADPNKRMIFTDMTIARPVRTVRTKGSGRAGEVHLPDPPGDAHDQRSQSEVVRVRRRLRHHEHGRPFHHGEARSESSFGRWSRGSGSAASFFYSARFSGCGRPGVSSSATRLLAPDPAGFVSLRRAPSLRWLSSWRA